MTDPDIGRREIGRTLLAIARNTLIEDLRGESLLPYPAPWLQDEGACFVTLHRRGELRGCIGTLSAHRPLLVDVQSNARAAAFGDPRFPPLEELELDDLLVEVSLLSTLESVDFESEQDLIRQLRPGVDGLLLESGFHRGTFLPAVWRSLPEPRLFLRNLKAKAGLAEDFWSSDLEVQRYTTQSWSEADFGD